VGAGDYVVHEAMELLAFTKDITIYTTVMNCKYPKNLLRRQKIQNQQKTIYKIDGSEFLQKIFFKDGTSEDIDGLFIAYESPSSVDFARKLFGPYHPAFEKGNTSNFSSRERWWSMLRSKLVSFTEPLRKALPKERLFVIWA